jgi:hypothetical protein
MDWNTALLVIVLGLQSIAVIGVSLMLIAESYQGRTEIGRDRAGHPGA